MINTVPAASVVGMGFSLLVAFALPITLFILCRKRLNAARLPALIGALTFTVAVLVLENAAHSLLRPLTSSPAVQGSVLLTAVYGGLMAALTPPDRGTSPHVTADEQRADLELTYAKTVFGSLLQELRPSA